MIYKRFSALLSMAVISSTTLAHDTFLLPAQNIWKVDSDIEVRMASGLSFPDLTWGVSQERISNALIELNGNPIPSQILSDNKEYLSITFKAIQQGHAVVAISTKTRSGTIQNEDTEEYLDEIGAPLSARKAFQKLPGKPQLHRSYVKHTKSFFCVENCKEDRAINLKPVGQKLEFVTTTTKNRFQLLFEGKPLAKHEVKVKDTTKKLFKFTTDANGQFTIDEKVSGTMMLSAVAVTLPEEVTGLYHSDYATLVLTRY